MGDINSWAANAFPVLADAANLGYERAVELLLKAGASPDLKHEYGWTALMQAATRNRIEVVHILIKTGASLKCAKHGTILDYVKQDTEMQKVIINALDKRTQQLYKDKRMEAEEFEILKDLAALPYWQNDLNVKHIVQLFEKSRTKQVNEALKGAAIPIYNTE